MNEFMNEATERFKINQEAMSDLSIVDISKAVDYINELSQFIPRENEVLDYLEDVLRPLEIVLERCITDKECPHCGCYLYCSDLPQYDYVCAECDENFYECEVKEN